MKTILFVHHSAELYGSDKTLLTLIQGLDGSRFHPIVMLPESGPLNDLLSRSGITTYVLPLAIISRATLSIRGVCFFLKNIISSQKAMNRAVENTRIDMVQTSTLAVISGALWAKKRGIPHIWHVHEIVEKPAIAVKMFTWLLATFSIKIVCNSYATMKWLVAARPALSHIADVIWNGFDRREPVEPQPADFRRQLGISSGDILVCLVGRINRWKGHGLLIEAAKLLWDTGIRNVHYLMVGSAPQKQGHFRDRLAAQIEASAAKSRFHLLEFRENIMPIWDACDIAVVPSTEPEPFGLVALEAMASQKPVVAANHGGLAEIVVPGETGILFEPGNPKALAEALSLLILEGDIRKRMGVNGAARARNLFTEKHYIDGFQSLYDRLA